MVDGSFYTVNGTQLQTFIAGTDVYNQNSSTMCSLNIYVKGSATIAAGSSVRAPSINFTVGGSVSLSGKFFEGFEEHVISSR